MALFPRIPFAGEHISLLVLNRFIAEQYVNDTGQKYVMVSFHGTDQERASIPEHPNLLGVVYVRCDDCERESEGKPITRFQARDVVQLIKKHLSEINLIVVHCQAGISRSSGCAAALSRLINGEDQFFFDCYRPNRLVYRTVLNEGLDIGLGGEEIASDAQ